MEPDEIIAMPLAKWRRYVHERPCEELPSLRFRLHAMTILAQVSGDRSRERLANRRRIVVEAWAGGGD